MSDDVAVIWSDDYLGYNMGGDHPMHPVRIDLTMRLARSLGVLDRPGVEIIAPTAATDDQLERIHTARYIDAVRNAPGHPWGIGHGLGTADNPIFWGMYESAALISGGTMLAAEKVWTGTHTRAVNIGGGLHHAMSSQASGFCVFNDLSLAIAWLLDHGAERVAYIDVDVHHGDGVQAAFYDDPRVLTVSVHETPLALWPHTGFCTETGVGDAVGTSVNLALPPGCTNTDWLRAFHAVVPNVLRQFRPQILITQCGCDSHHEDPLADLSLTVDGHSATYAALKVLADELCEGKWVATGGGGYGLVRAVPRAWTHLLAHATGAAIDTSTEIPQVWLDQLTELRLPDMPSTSLPGITSPPTTMGEGASVDYEPWAGDNETPIDRAIIAARGASYPLAGLDPADPRD